MGCINSQGADSTEVKRKTIRRKRDAGRMGTKIHLESNKLVAVLVKYCYTTILWSFSWMWLPFISVSLPVKALRSPLFDSL